MTKSLKLLMVLALVFLTTRSWSQPNVGLPDTQKFLDVAAYKKLLIHQVDLFDGGLDGQSGMGAFDQNFTGWFNVNLGRNWSQGITGSVTAVAQARAIFMNVQAYRASHDQKYLKIANLGIDFMLAHFWDKKYGGFYWEVGRDGEARSRSKQGYGNVHALMVLADAYGATKNIAHLRAAMNQLGIIGKYFKDQKFPGAVFPGFRYDFSEVEGVNNVDTFTHYFEALLALHDVTQGANLERVKRLLLEAGNFLISHLYTDQTGFTDRGYVAYNLDKNWKPSQLPYTRGTQWSGAMHSTPGHCIELAYLLSRAVERGFDPGWLTTAAKLQRFTEDYAINPETGGMLYETLDYDGKPLLGNPDNAYYIWWAQAEVARAMLHFSVVRNQDRAQAFKRAEKLILEHFLDPEFGGWFQQVRADTLAFGDPTKGNVWTMNYHETMFYAEILRLNETYPARIKTLSKK